ncbi:Protein of unknown function [Cnuella takakiae]|uniref:DUF4199 domain-containing protein n=1 Tax=Cnuella takakiae TaxID=1302690 RepID=A0A1M5HEM1_9BACT|nr:DUF4199 domain-containing protein [Cnuella takakiae]OLY92845.1 hypothetical protein BUE76_13835 [Cnuella takakiae]SHG14429.1 Protein of unknown function [Cnuella takakiae]
MQEQKPITHVQGGLIIAGILVVASTIIQFMNLSNNPGAGLIQPVVIILGLLLLIRAYGKANNYTLSFGNLFAYGFKSTAVFTIISIAFSVIFLLLFPDLKEKSFEMARQQMEDNPKLTEEQIDQAIEISRKFFWVGIVGGSMIFMIILGAIGSLIGAAATKKQPNNPFIQETH